MKKTKLLNIICSMLVGILFILAVLLVMIASGAVSLKKVDIVFKTESSQALYDGKPLTNHQWSISEGALKEGHHAEITFRGSQTSAGESENSIRVRIRDLAGADVTGDYNIDYDLGKLTVNPRPLTVTSASAEKIYDGKILRDPTYTVSDSGLVTGHKLIAAVTGQRYEIGESYNTIATVMIVDRYGQDVTGNYRIILREGTLRVRSQNGGTGPSGPGSSAGDTVDFDGNSNLLPQDGKEDTVLYSVYSTYTGTVYLKMKSYGDYTGSGFKEVKNYPYLLDNKYSASYLTSFALQKKAAKYQIAIKSYGQPYALPYYMDMNDSSNYTLQESDVQSLGDASKQYALNFYLYDQSNLSEHVKVNISSFESNYRHHVKNTYLYVDPETLAGIREIIREQNFSASDKDIINKVAYYVQTCAKYNGEYDRKLDSEENVALAFLNEYKEGVCRHYAMAATLIYRALGIPARYTVGAMAETQAGKWVDVIALQAHAWVEVYIDGVGWIQVEVTGGSSTGTDEEDKKTLVITPKSMDVKYNGKVHYASNTVKGFEELAALDYTYTATVTGSRREIGVSQTNITNFVIYDPDGRDVTSQFKITFKPGTIHIYDKVISLRSNSYTMKYGSTPKDSVVYVGGQLDPNHEYRTVYTGESSVGMHMNTFDVLIVDSAGNDVTLEYKIDKTYGTITVTAAPLTVKAGDATKKYDGTPLTSSEAQIISGTLMEGDVISRVEVSGTQTSIGRSENTVISVVIRNKNGDDVTQNYNIVLEPGQLTVTP